MQDPDKLIHIANLRGLDLPHMNLRQAGLRKVNLYGSDLSRASLSEANGSEAEAEFNRLLAAAVINSKFRQLLLTNPAQAIEAGFQNEKFYFSENERQHLLSIKAQTLEEFALQLMAHLRPSINNNSNALK